MTAVAIYIVAQSSGTPMALARVDDRQAILSAAEAAIAEAEAKAMEMEAADDLLAELQRGEVEQLRWCLQLVIPELRLRATSTAAVM